MFLEIHNLKTLFLCMQLQLQPTESVHRVSCSQQFGNGDPTSQPMQMKRMVYSNMEKKNQ